MFQRLQTYIGLSKPKIVSMVMVSSCIGFLLAGGELSFNLKLIALLFGTAATAAGGAALNNLLERDLDARMYRTKERALPLGLISPASALAYGVCLVLLGVIVLGVGTNLLSAFLALLTGFLYVVVYTPLKRITWLNTAVGAIPGALPPMGGWVAATGNLELGAYLLFLILFCWQQPHFYAIAWIYRDDYARGGFKMLPVLDDENGKRTMFQIVLFSALLIPISLLPFILNISGPLYLFGAFLLGLVMLSTSFFLANSRSLHDARALLRASLIYLPVLLLLIVGDITLLP